jgi:MFS family permease
MARTQPRIFYGWWIVCTSAVGLCLGPPVSVFSFGVFFKSLVHEFHASRGAVSFAFTLHNVIGALCLPIIGRLVDRFGPRRVILPATTIFGLILISGIWLGSSIWQFYLFYAALGFALSGCNPVPYGVAISHWFNRYRGLALGLMALGVGGGSILVPPVAQHLIAMFGWRMAYGLLGAAVLLLPLPTVAALLQNDPAQRGLHPDGADAAQSAPERPQDKQGLSWREIWHQPTYWLMLCVFCLSGASLHAGVLHMPALLTDRGLSAERGAVASSVIGLSLLFGRIGSGYLLDHIFAPRVAMLFYGASALGIGMLWAGDTGNIAMMAAFLVGLGMGAEVEVIGYMLSRYFGLFAFGSAFGHVFGAFMLSGAAGALLMGAGFDRTHSYTAPLAGFCIAMVIALGLLTRLGPYRYGVDGQERLPLEPARAVSSA